jgi:transposase InsO family protein
MPNGLWEQLNGDLYGPMVDGTFLFVLIDEYTRFPIVREVASSSAIKVIPVLHEKISTFGVNDKLKTDNGPPFNGTEFKPFCDTFGIKHQLITPYWPQANPEAERFIPSLTKVIRNAEATDRDWRQELQFFLATYRATPHSSTEVAPAELLFKFNGGSRLVSLSGIRFNQKMDIDRFARVKDQLA